MVRKKVADAIVQAAGYKSAGPMDLADAALAALGITHTSGAANMNLIAAAPDLYAALEAAIDCGMVPKSSVADGGATRHSRHVQVADMIRAALAKARGET